VQVGLEAGFMTKSLCKKKWNLLNYFITGVEVLLIKSFYGESGSWITAKSFYGERGSWIAEKNHSVI